MTALLAHQLRFDLLALRRNRRMQMFGLALPLVLLVCFAGLFDSTPVEVAGQLVPADRASVPGIMGLAVLTSSFMGLAMTVVTQRQLGVLKRRRSTPCPAWVLVSSRALGKTILLTTHYMEEAERLADRIVVMARGEIVAAGTPATLGGRDRAAAVVTFTLPPGAGDSPLGLEVDADRRVSMRTERPMSDLHELTAWALERDVELSDLEIRRPTLEDIYLELTR